ncbi:MAG: ABC transporter permease [Patescibacteria group bacterium]|jgi:putative ABC transport system permease protein|nr:ABC transporter permease [Patescibacteria group bacterium]
MKFEILKMAFESLLANKTRSFLSMLGIIIGVSTVIAVFAIGEGAKQAVDDQFAGLSAKSVMVMGVGGRGATASTKLSIDDVDALKEGSVYIGEATGMIQSNGSISYNSIDSSYSIIGVDADFFGISNLELSSGRFFTEEEEKEKYIILGSDLYDNFFEEGENAIGAEMTVNQKKMEVIGVLKETGSTLGRLSKDEAIYIPYKIALSSILGSGGQIMLTLEADSVENVTLATEEATEILREEHGLRSSQDDDFRIMDAGSMVGAAQDSASLMSTILTLVAAITLLVSGIGIMNVMFVTVAERTKEIGIAKAIGGKQIDILGQFLMESVILSTFGGLIGVIIGQTAVPIISNLNILAMSASVTGPILGFSFSALVGITFGFYPALKASRLDPVDALRSE